jgi:transcriptional regulator
MTDQALRGHLDLLLLATLADGPRHGYAVIEELRRRSGDAFDLPEGTVYPALHRLERAGSLASDWDTSSGRRRRVYRITPTGRKALGLEQQAWKRFSAGMSAVLKGVSWETT